MRRAKRWLLIFAALLGLMAHTGALRPGFPKLSQTTATTSTTTTTTTTTTEVPETTVASAEETAQHSNGTTKASKKLTGIPQIDWVWDPNLPRELNGYNLSSYPFFSTVPPHNEIAFKCDGLHDGFYASIEYKCQVYHHCIYGIRHDFLCANFTAFDQRTFICHFVSEVDCENSAKFWNRNDNLYMATTTTSTTTTSTPAPLTPEPQFRPRPNRRPLRRRRPSDYYYDEEYDDDYYEEERRANRRRKQRPRNRRPEYDDEYEEKRAYSDEDPRFDNKRSKNKDPIREEEPEDDYIEDRRSKPKARPKSSSVARQGDVSERRNQPISRKTAADRKTILDERRSLSDDREKPRNRLDEDPEPVPERRPLAGGRRRKHGKKRPAPIDDDLDRPLVRDEVDEEIESPAVDANPAPAKEEIVVRPQTSAAAQSPIASIFDRPRVAPKIPRPVPIHERSKFGYQGQKATTSTTTVSSISDEYYDDQEYEDEPADKRETPRRRLQDELSLRRTDDSPPRRSHSQSRRGSENPKRISKPLPRKPVAPIDDEYDSIPASEDTERRPSVRKRPHANRERSSLEDSDVVEEPVRESRPRSRRPLRKEEPIVEDTRDRRRDHRRRPAEVDKAPLPVPAEDTEVVYDEHVDEDADEKSSANLESDKPAGRPVVRVVKRPFLPSRGGSPYLPRGLQPVGGAQKQSSTESTPVDMGSTISGVRLLEHGAPILRESGPSGSDSDYTVSPRKGPRTTLPPQIEHPKAILDELYENDYDVTLNDALNPTLKPISSSNRNSLSSYSKHDRAGYSPADSYFSSTDVRRRTIPAPRNTRQEFRGATRVAQHFYEDFEY